MTVNELTKKFGFKPICLPQPDRTVKGCYVGDLLSWVMGRANADNAWITIMSNVNIAAVASLTDVSIIILAEGVEPDAGVAETAEQKGINIVSSPLPAFETAAAVASDV